MSKFNHSFRPAVECLEGRAMMSASFGGFTGGTYTAGVKASDTEPALTSDVETQEVGIGTANLFAFDTNTPTSGDSYYGTGVYKSVDSGKTWALAPDDGTVDEKIAEVTPDADAGNQGWGVWEVNPAQVLDAGTTGDDSQPDLYRNIRINQSESPATPGADETITINESRTETSGVTVTGTSGTFTLTFNGQTT